jgi:hypothetical protein
LRDKQWFTRAFIFPLFDLAHHAPFLSRLLENRYQFPVALCSKLKLPPYLCSSSTIRIPSVIRDVCRRNKITGMCSISRQIIQSGVSAISRNASTEISSGRSPSRASATASSSCFFRAASNEPPGTRRSPRDGHSSCGRWRVYFPDVAPPSQWPVPRSSSPAYWSRKGRDPATRRPQSRCPPR